jgi:hypothetical protein
MSLKKRLYTRKPGHWFLWLLWVFVWLPVSIGVCHGQASSSIRFQERVDELLRSSKSTLGYTPLTSSEFETAQSLFVSMLEKKVEKVEVQSAWETLGYRLYAVMDQGVEYWVLIPESPSKKGHGFFVFCMGACRPVCIQAPHRYHDLYTEDLALSLFVESQSQVCAWNTAHRDIIDFGKSETSLFHALSLACLEQASMSILQLHGFGSRTFSSADPDALVMILSNGTKKPSQTLFHIERCLEKGPALDVRVYPLEVQVLGGTTNVAAKAFAQKRLSNFLHVEMNLRFRQILRKDKALRQQLISCFILNSIP